MHIGNTKTHVIIFRTLEMVCVHSFTNLVCGIRISASYITYRYTLTRYIIYVYKYLYP